MPKARLQPLPITPMLLEFTRFSPPPPLSTFVQRSTPPPPHGDSIHFDVSSARQVIGSALVYIYRWRCRTRATFAAESNPRTEGEGMVIRSSFRGENSHRIAGRRGRNEFIITSRSGARWKSPAGRVEEDKFIKGRKKWWWSKGRRGLESRVSVERVSRAHSPHARREADKTYAD